MLAPDPNFRYMFDFQYLHQIIRGGRDFGLAADLIANIRKEIPEPEGWTTIQHIREDDPSLQQMAKDVGLRRIACPLCKYDGQRNLQKRVWLLSRGKVTGVEIRREHACWCVKQEMFWNIWKMIPEAFQGVELGTLRDFKRSYLARSLQKECIAILREHPDRNYIMCGDVGVGKTVFAYALLERAAKIRAETGYTIPGAPPSVWRVLASEYMTSRTEWETKKSDEDEVAYPPLMPQHIRAASVAGLRPFVVLEELDKLTNFNATKARYLFELVDAIYNTGGQLIVTTNKSASELKQYLSSEGEKGIWRRMELEDREKPAIIWNFNAATTVKTLRDAANRLPFDIDNGRKKDQRSYTDAIDLVVDDEVPPAPVEGTPSAEPPPPKKGQPQLTKSRKRGPSSQAGSIQANTKPHTSN